MTKIFDSFYFLHIRKTGGRSYKDNFLSPLKDRMEMSNIKILNDNIDDYDSHRQWLDEINDLTYVTCTFRDPCEQIVSLYVHNKSFKLNSSVSKKEFLNWFEKNENGLSSNYQSKNIVSPPMTDGNNINFFNKKNITKDQVLNKISKMSLFIKTETLKENNRTPIQNKILSDMNIYNLNINNLKWKDDEYKNNYSKDIYNSLTIKEKDSIRSTSSVDSEIYESESLFWKI
jgi:hypothetical protein